MELSPVVTLQELAIVDVNQLPPQAKVIIRLIGINDAWTLFSHLGGKEIKIPTGKYADTYLHQTIPEASASALIKEFAGRRIAIPKKDKIVSQIRNHRIYHAKTQGEIINSLASRFRLTRRRIFTICRQMADEQLSQKNT